MYPKSYRTPEDAALIDALKAEVEAYRLELELVKKEKDDAVNALANVVNKVNYLCAAVDYVRNSP